MSPLMTVIAAGGLLLLGFLFRKHSGMLCFIGRLLRDLVKSRGGMLGHRLMGRFWSDTATPPSLSKVAMARVGEVTVVRTAKRTGERLSVLEPLKMEPGVPTKGEPAVVLDSNVRYQTFLGFGGSFTESSADVFKQMGEESQAQIIEAYFSEEKGIGYRLGRLHMNSCDFSKGHWACAETAGATLADFSIEHYQGAILPMLRKAVAAAGQPLSLVFSPWSPPAWMKDSGNMHKGKLLAEHARTWANYYCRFAQEFAAAGMPFWGLTIQNEPDADTPWETCYYSAEDERDFIRDNLGPALEENRLDLKVIIWDHNRDDMFARARTIFSDPAAAKYIWGTGYHWYGDPRYEWWPDRGGQVLFDNLQRVHELRPDKHIIMTECCQEMGPRIGNWQLGERYGEAIIRDLNHWLEAWIDWNLVLDATGGPNHVGNKCSSPIIADIARDSVLFLSSYYYIGHFSRYIRPGAQRILAVSNRDHLETTAFANPDGSQAVVVQNRTSRSVDFWLQSGGSAVKTLAPANSITTFCMGPTLLS